MPHSWEPKWQVVRKLGKGGQGVTQLVTSSETTDLQGVLKYLINNQNPVNRARMNREVASLEELATAGAKVPNVLDHNTALHADPSVELFLVMEFIDGPTMDTHVKSTGPLSVDEAIDFALALCETVRIAHAQGIFHRDIKPENIIVHNGTPIIIDFGLSFNQQASDLTETDETFKNKFLALPETNTTGGNRRDPRSDVTAVCAIFYFMLTKKYIGQLHDSSGRMAHTRTECTLRDAGMSDARLTQIELVLNRGLAHSIQNRFDSIDEFSDRLKALREQSATNQVSDPIAIAADLAKLFAAQDRRTQLSNMKPAAQKLLEAFKDKVDHFSSKIPPFKMEFGPGGHEGQPLTPNFDKVAGPYHLTLHQAQYPEKQRGRVYKIAARGNQCVVLAGEVSPVAGKPSKSAYGQWCEIAWYEGGPNIMNELEVDFKNWLSRQQQELAAEILAQQS